MKKILEFLETVIEISKFIIEVIFAIADWALEKTKIKKPKYF